MPAARRRRCRLLLSDGSSFAGSLVGAPLSSSGELVFTTAMVGYTETLTDPSYFGQVIVFTYPLIGNYGVPPAGRPGEAPPPRGWESDRVRAAGAVLGTGTDAPGHWASGSSLDAWLLAQGVPGVSGLDGRLLTRRIRSTRRLRAKLLPEDPEGERLLGEGLAPDRRGFFDPGEHAVTPHVSRKEPLLLGKGRRRIALLDLGLKWGIARALLSAGCEVLVLPWDAEPASADCDGWVLSNGPGDPARALRAIETARSLVAGKVPVLGICLGHQILALAAGARTRRMRYGHRSHNQPVLDRRTGRGALTSQNHGYVVEEKSLPRGWEPWFINANDGTLEGLRHRSGRWRGVQFHPEASAGPRDTAWILERFAREPGGSW